MNSIQHSAQLINYRASTNGNTIRSDTPSFQSGNKGKNRVDKEMTSPIFGPCAYKGCLKSEVKRSKFNSFILPTKG